MNHPEMAAAVDRPARGIEVAIQRLSSLNQMTGNLEHRLRGMAERLVHGPAPEQPKLHTGESTTAPTSSELSQLSNEIDRLEHQLQMCLDAVVTLEGV